MVERWLRTDTDDGETLVNEDAVLCGLGSTPVGTTVTEAFREGLWCEQRQDQRRETRGLTRAPPESMRGLHCRLGTGDD